MISPWIIVNRKLAEEYFNILEDLLLSVRLPAFRKRARRRIVAHPKFFLFDTGVYRTIRPKGVLDRPEEIDGAALETLVFQELRAVNDNFELGYDLFHEALISLTDLLIPALHKRPVKPT